ncbi:hypothetical protein [Gemmatimonas sp.]|uniref:hypothetical protein n=1 Tax=Gemmatimonas sp. TaxID=1962908 RepID=UPI003569F810
MGSTGGVVQAVDFVTTPISIASCPGLLAAVTATSCTEMESGGETYALTLTDLTSGVGVTGYQLATEGSAIAAIAQVSGTVVLPETPGVVLEVEAFRVPVSTGDVLGLVATVGSEEGESSTVELFTVNDGVLMPAVVLSDGRAELATDGNTIAAVFIRDQQNRRYTTLYPMADGWMSVTEVLEKSVARSRVDASAPVQQPIEIVLEREPVPIETVPAVQTDGFGATGTLIDGYGVPCDGAWITIVGSKTYEQVAAALAGNPAAMAVKNADTCPSLNPTFSGGSLMGEDIYVVFYGPFYFLDEARGTCNQLGFTAMNDCFVAPLTFNAGDRSVRYGPL